LRIGNRTGGTDRTFDGDIGEVRIYNRPLTPTEISQNYNATKSKYTTGDIFTVSTLVSVPNNDAPYVSCRNSVMPYAGSANNTIQQIWTSFGLVQTIGWEYGTTFTDLTGNSNNATPSFRTATSDIDVTAELTSFRPVTEARAPAYAISDAPAFITTVPSVNGTFTSGNITGTWPGHDVIVAIAIGGETPQQFVFYILSVVFILSIALACAYFLAKYARGDTTLALAIIIFCMLCIGVVLRVTDVWQVYFFVIIAWGIRELEKDSRGI